MDISSWRKKAPKVSTNLVQEKVQFGTFIFRDTEQTDFGF